MNFIPRISDTPAALSAVIFDMDGVLADTEPLHGGCFVTSFAAQGIDIGFEDYRLAVTIGGSTVRDFYLSLGGDPSSWDEVKALKDELMESAVREHARPMPGVIDLLRSLKDVGIRTAVATSARRTSLGFVLDKLGIWEFFDCFVSKEDTGAEKPDPSIFLLAAHKLGVHPSNCITIEDSPRGTVASQRAGMRCVAVPTDTTFDGDFTLATTVVSSLEKVSVETLTQLMAYEVQSRTATLTQQQCPDA
ncbi:MAG TPA: HAD family phosphatase [Armatimonadota bacterium]